MKAIQRTLICSLLWAVSLAGTPARAAPTVSQQMEQLIEQQQPVEAYELGQKSSEAKGEEFDLWFGTAAAMTQRSQEGADALQRFIREHPASPQIPRARAELARALAAQEKFAAARAEFQAVLATNPPEIVANNVRALLATIEAMEKARQPRLTGYLEAGGGYDSNVNGGVSIASVSTPLGTLTINESGKKTDAAFAHLAGGAGLAYPMTRATSLLANADAVVKLNDDADDYDQQTYSVSAGVSHDNRIGKTRAILAHTRLLLDTDQFVRFTGLNLDWAKMLSPNAQASLLASASDLDYTGDNDPRDARQYGLGAGLAYGLSTSWPVTLSLAILGNRERTRDNRPDLGRNVLGARASVTLAPTSKLRLSLGATLQGSRYRGADPLFQLTRRDDYTSADLAASYELRKALSLRAEYSRMRNTSNIAINAYDRDLVILKLRYDFN